MDQTNCNGYSEEFSKTDLNMMPVEINGKVEKQKDAKTYSASVYSYFKNIDKYLIKYIYQADAIFGCTCWLTHQQIIEALIATSSILIVNKDDQVRPAISKKQEYSQKTLDNYSRISFNFNELELPKELKPIEKYSDKLSNVVRCCGAYRKTNSSMMHNKFLVFCKAKRQKDNNKKALEPYGVWTGSFNFTPSACSNFENAVFIRNDKIAKSFLIEFCQIFMLSEKLPWEQTEPSFSI